MPVQQPRRTQGFDDALERDVFMRQRIERRPADVGHERPERRGVAGVEPEDEHVREEADEIFRPRVPAAGAR